MFHSAKKDKKKKTRFLLTQVFQWCNLASRQMKLREQIKKLPVGKVIEVSASCMTLVRYHARGCREIKSRANLKTGKRDVFLGEFLRKGKDVSN